MRYGSGRNFTPTIYLHLVSDMVHVGNKTYTNLHTSTYEKMYSSVRGRYHSTQFYFIFI